MSHISKAVAAVCFSLISFNLLAADVLITNQLNQPIVGAQVVVGNAPGDPFEGNVLTTDVNGYLPIPSEWRSALPITIEAENYVRTTFPSVLPEQQHFQLHRADGEQKLEVRGQATNFGRLRKDGKVDFSLVFPAMNRRSFLQFDISSVLSPEQDEMKIITKRLLVPSNLSLPKQKENYILPITIEKPVYRMFVRQPGEYRMTALHGQFPLQRVINDINNGKSYFEVINHFRFLGGGQLDVNVTDNQIDKDIQVDQMKFSETVSVTAPTYNSNNVVVGMSLVDQGDLFFPSDLKRLRSGETKALKIPPGAADKAFIISLLTPDRDFEAGQVDEIINGPEEETNLLQMMPFEVFNAQEALGNNPKDAIGGLSFALKRASSSTPSRFLELIDEPVINGDVLDLTPPNAVEGIEPIGTLVILSEVDTNGESRMGEVRTRKWEILSNEWLDQLELPKIALDLDPTKTHRWEVMYLGRNSEEPVNEDTYILDTVSHLTRSSVDF